jgi:hypothetical protein
MNFIPNETQDAVPRRTPAGPIEEIVGKELIAYHTRKDVWTCKLLTVGVQNLKQDAQVLRKRNRVRFEIGVSSVDAQKYTFGRVTRCAA